MLCFANGAVELLDTQLRAPKVRVCCLSDRSGFVVCARACLSWTDACLFTALCSPMSLRTVSLSAVLPSHSPLTATCLHFCLQMALLSRDADVLFQKVPSSDSPA